MRRELVTRLYEALGSGNAEGLSEVLHERFTGVVTSGMPLGLGGEYSSADAMRDEFWWRLGRTWSARAEPSSFHDLDDGRLLVEGAYRGRVRSSSARLEAAFVHLLSFQDERIIGLEQLTDSAAWQQSLVDGPLETIQYDVEDGLAIVRLARQESRNAIDLRLASETLTVARRIQRDDSVRAVLICAAGDHFTVGGDLSYIAEAGQEDLGALLRTMTTPFHEAFDVMSRLEVPIVAAVQGSVAGGGIGYVYAADITIAADDARFVTAFASIGLSGDGGGSWHLPRRVGVARAANIMLRNRPVPADEAERIGLIAEVVPRADLEGHATAVARTLAAGPTQAYGAMRQLLRNSWSTSLGDQLRAETDVLSRVAGTADAVAAISAFAAKEQPTFEGR